MIGTANQNKTTSSPPPPPEAAVWHSQIRSQFIPQGQLVSDRAAKPTVNWPPFRHREGEPRAGQICRPQATPWALQNSFNMAPCEWAKSRWLGKIPSLPKPGSSIPKRCLVGVGGREFLAWLSPASLQQSCWHLERI